MNYKRLFIENTYVFLTIITHKRKKILIKNIKLLRKSFSECKKKYNFDIFSIVIMPNHIHMIIKPENIYEYPKIVGQIKSYFTKNLPFEYELNSSREANIWQRRYWEHTIRDEEDLYKYLDYIHFNPIKHGVVMCVNKWDYSSFKKFVKMGYYETDWCNFGDKHNISDMNLE
jgi:putative transposase